MTKNKILVTGAAGYIGGTFTYEVLKKGFKVHGIDNFINPNKAHNELNWQAKLNLERMCKDAWEATKK